MAPNEDRDSIIEDEILAKFLDNAAAKAMRNIEEQGSLSTEDAIPLMLKSQFNHIAHLEKQMVTKVEFKGLENKFQVLKDLFQGLKDQFSFLKWVIGIGFVMLFALNLYIIFFK